MRKIRSIASIAAGLGLLLVLTNVVGFSVPLRAQDVNGYRDFAGVETFDFETTMTRLASLTAKGASTSDLVTEATRIFHAGIAHVSRDDIRANGLEHYRMRVPVTENWILYALSYLKPDTYEDYEFCNYKRALERGTGRCGQQSLALVSYLSAQGIETGFVALGGHAIVTARVDDSRWYLLDPDYGGVIPFGIDEAAKEPESVLQYYWSTAARENRLDELYATENEVRYGGPEARYARACPIETVAYVLKWAVPLLLLLPLPLLILVNARRFRPT